MNVFARSRGTPAAAFVMYRSRKLSVDIRISLLCFARADRNTRSALRVAPDRRLRPLGVDQDVALDLRPSIAEAEDVARIAVAVGAARFHENAPRPPGGAQRVD